MSRRYAIERGDGELEVWLPSQLRVPWLFIGGWLLVYSLPALFGNTPAVIEGVRQYAAAAPEHVRGWVTLAFYVAWLLVGVGPAVAGTLLVCYQFLGWERLRVTGDRVTVRREVLGLGRRKRYPRSILGEARLVPSVPLKRWFVGTGSIVLGSGAKAFRIGASLAPAEAAEVLAVLSAEVEGVPGDDG